MKRKKPLLMLWVAMLIAVMGVLPALPASAITTNYVTVSKTVNPSTITTEETAEVTLNIQGTPPVNVVVPNDVILIIDKSGSMLPQYNNGEDKMKNAKEAAKGFIDLMDLTKHRVGIVDFSSSNNIGSYPLTTDNNAVKAYIDGIQAGGATATGDAISVAQQMLADHRPEAQPVIIILTDGDATQPSGTAYQYAIDKAALSKDAGIVFYTIALLAPTDDPATSGPNKLLMEMATTASHHHFVLGSTGLSDIYAAIVKEIGQASAYDVTVTDVVSPDFEIVPDSYTSNIPQPAVSGNTLIWSFKELKNSTLSFKYLIRPVNKSKAGSLPVSTSQSSITYKDYAGANRTLAIPSVNLTVKLPAPVITSVIEPSGHPNGGETVILQGINFVSGATVTFGSTSATNVQFVSANEIRVTAPKGVQGTVDVTLKNPDGQKATASYQYKADPVITSISPPNGPLEGKNLVTIRGDYMMKGATIKFGENVASISTYTNTTYLQVTVPAAIQPGTVDVSLVNPDGTSVVVPGGYTYDKPVSTDPVVTSITPNTSDTKGGITAYVGGKYFKSGMTVQLGGISATTTFVSDTRLQITVPAASQAGQVDVTVLDVNGTPFTLANAFTYTDPVIPKPNVTSITPISGDMAGGTTVYINGSNFMRDSSVYFGIDAATSVTYISDTRISAKTPASLTAGKVDVTVMNGTLTSVLPQAFEFIAPQPVPVVLTGVSPNTGTTNGGELIYITGENLKTGATILFGTKQAQLVSVYSSNKAGVRAPASDTTGFVDVTWTNKDGGTATLSSAYEYTAVRPTITSLSPTSGTKDGGTTVYINGTLFNNSMTVMVNGIQVPYTFYSDTRIGIVTPPGSPGTVPITVTLANGQSASADFTYVIPALGPAPVITSMTMTSGAAAGGYTLYISGSNFVKNATVTFGGVPGVVTFVSSTRLQVKVPAGTAGPVSVKVTNPDLQDSNVVTFTYTS